MKYVGLRNFQKMFKSSDMLDTIGRTFRYALVILPVTLAGGFSLGLLLSSKSKVNVFFRTVLFDANSLEREFSVNEAYGYRAVSWF